MPFESLRSIAKNRWLFYTFALICLILAGLLWKHDFDTSELHGTKPLIRSGPWGDLQEWDLRLEHAPEFASSSSVSQPPWGLGTLSPQSVQDLLRQSGCSEQQTALLMRGLSRTPEGRTTLVPDREALLSLSPEVRSKLYLSIARDPLNGIMATPVLVPDGKLKRVFVSHPHLYPKVKDLMGKLCYRRNGFTYFSDVDFVKSQLESEKDKVDFQRAISGIEAVNARLIIRDDTDIDKPINYWGVAMNGVLLKDLRPFFEAEKALPHGGTLSILYVLPPMARARLFTSPLPPDPRHPEQALPNCHWTALNFFKATPDDQLTNNEYAAKYLLSNYYQIENPGMAGDLVLLKDKKGEVIHSAVFLADDLVFTKNGVTHAQPWILMHIKEMAAHYSAIDPVDICFYRQRGM